MVRPGWTTASARNVGSAASTGDEADRAALHPGFLLTPERFAWLHGWIERHYPEDLRPADLADPHLLRRTRDALDELSRWMGVPALYPFQGALPP